MPYISKDDRDRMQENEGDLNIHSKGVLNYAISSLLVHYILQHGKSYQSLSDCIAACDDAKEEFRRRVMNPYEDRAIERNGDTYPEEVLK